MIPFYLATFEMTVNVLAPALLLMAGLILNFYLHKKIQSDPDLTEVETKQIVLNSGIAFAGIALVGVLPRLSLELSLMGLIMLGILWAVAEEQFFRASLTNGIDQMTNNRNFAILGSALIFSSYHLARYPEASLFFFTLGSGAVLAWVALRTQRVSPCIIGHSAWNVYGVIGNVVPILLVVVVVVVGWYLLKRRSG